VTEQVVALLRGINVGRAKRVAMADLRALLAELGYREPRTLLNSGNAVFGCTRPQADKAAAVIERAIGSQLGVDCAVLTRTASQWQQVISGNPLLDLVTDPSKHLVGFMSAPLAPEAVAQLEEGDYGSDRLRIVGTEAYLWCASGILDSALPTVSGTAWRKYGVDVTTRNWNTVLKLGKLAGLS
jgi:uncharacterized protein (DUF1697 family)